MIYFRFKRVIKAMSEIDGLLNVLLPDTDERDEGENRRDFLLSVIDQAKGCLLYTSPSPRDGLLSRMPSSA